MYSAILGMVDESLGLVGANWTPLVFAGLGTLIVLFRTQREEKMMLEQFGDEYREYIKQTGRLLPVPQNGFMTVWSNARRPSIQLKFERDCKLP